MIPHQTLALIAKDVLFRFQMKLIMINEESVIVGILCSVECKLLLQAIDAMVVAFGHIKDLKTSFCVLFSLAANLHFSSSLACKPLSTLK